MILTVRDQRRMLGLHPDLSRLIEAAALDTPIRFTILEGVRTFAQQAALVERGASKTMNSRHLTGHAVDIAPLAALTGGGNLDVSWHWPDYHRLAPHIKRVAEKLKIPIEWGGDWRKFKDGPHWQLPWKHYPKGGDL